ncbi:cytochrome P450 9e2-like isoform X2 [Euwallacea fornicatus]|uniref:cytochrome P450 9e2-like isoform X2 n=1 Tax=Euwallacea fornicatus TaxID=995702 RepID=UPI00338F619C
MRNCPKSDNSSKLYINTLSNYEFVFRSTYTSFYCIFYLLLNFPSLLQASHFPFCDHRQIMFLLICVIFLIIYIILVHPYTYWTIRGVKQGKPWILFGDSWGTVFRVMDMAEMVSYNYHLIPNTRYYGVYQFFKPKLVIRDPDLIKQITVKDFEHFEDRSAMVDPKADPLFARNLLSLKGDEWKKMRETLTNSFTSSKMKLMFGLITDAAENFIKYFADKKGSTIDVEMKDAFTRFTIDVIASTSFGVKVNSLFKPDNQFFKMGKEMTELNFKAFLKVLLFQFSPYLYRLLKLRMFRKEVNDFFRNLINDALKSRKKGGIYRPDMLQILIEARKGLTSDDNDTEGNYFKAGISNEDITAQAVIFFFAGFDSVSSLMTFTVYELAMNHEIQDKLREEIRQTLKNVNGKVTYEAIMDMKYMQLILQEALRKWPPFVVLGRECTKSYTIKPALPDEVPVTIPKGLAIQIPVYALHHDPQYFPEPENFIPERFSPENRGRITPYTCLEFGQGPRSCLAPRFALLETKIVLFYLVNRFKLVTSNKMEVPLKLSKNFSINIRPAKGLWICLEKLDEQF